MKVQRFTSTSIPGVHLVLDFTVWDHFVAERARFAASGSRPDARWRFGWQPPFFDQLARAAPKFRFKACQLWHWRDIEAS